MGNTDYLTADAQQLRELGRQRGRMVADDVELPVLGSKKSLYSYLLSPHETIEDTEDVKEVFLVQVHEHEMHDRDYEPFIRDAITINTRPDREFAWEAFLHGVDIGIKEVMEEKIIDQESNT